ncbi:MAG: hypothetical protein AABW86_02540 [Candidatus Micrarchaeota archaeon]
MKVEITDTTENKLYERKEIKADVSFVGSTPKKAEIKAELAGKVGANPEVCVIRKIKNEFGKQEVAVLMHSYDNAETMKKNEPNFVLVREGLAPKKEKKKKEKKTAAPAKKK